MNYDILMASEKLGIPVISLKNHIDIFYRDFKKNLPRIEDVVKSKDSEKIYFEFHKLKSTFKMISAHEAEEICRQCCEYSRENLPFEYAQAISKIRASFESLNDQIKGMKI